MARFCTNCGKEITDTAKFCRACGSAQSFTQKQQQADINPLVPATTAKQRGKNSLIIGSFIILGIATITVALIVNFAGGFSGNTSDDDFSGTTTYEIFGDGKLITEPRRLQARASGDDKTSAAALIGPWEGTRNRLTTEYGFTDDGYFYKGGVINNSYLTSTYHPGYTSYGSYYNTYYSGYWTHQTNVSYTYLDTVVGEYEVKGGVIEFRNVFTISRTTFDDNWYNAKTRTVSIEQLRQQAKSSRSNEFSVEFEFISTTRLRLRDESSDLDLFWEIEDDPHDVKLPKHEIPAVDWPVKALSPDMPDFKTKGRIREASLSYSGDDKNIKAEFKTVTVVIDKTDALSEISAYGGVLKKNGWWVEDYQLGSKDTSLRYEARKGMFQLVVSNGNGSGTGEDTIVIESTKYPEGQWPKTWSAAGFEPPDKAAIVGVVKAEPDDDKDIYETIVFDKVDGSGVKTYMDKLVRAGFKRPQYAYEDNWEMMKYIRIDKDLYLTEIALDQRMDSLSAFTYHLTYVPDGKWPEIWKNAGLPAPEGIEAIAGAIDVEQWAESLTDYGSDYQRIKFLGLDANETDAYLSKLKTSGFAQIEDDWDDSVRLYHYLRIDGKMLRVEVSPLENEDIAEISYDFTFSEDGRWPEIWQDAGLSAPEGMSSIVGVIDLEEWRQQLTEYGSDYQRIQFLGLDNKEAEAYLSKLKSLGFRQIEDDWDDTMRLYHYLRIDGRLCRVEVRAEQNDELAEFTYSFESFEDGQWPSSWASAGIPSPSFTAMLGAIDLTEFNESISDWGSYYESIKLLGANLADYAALLRRNGFVEPEYSYTDTWELEKLVQFAGKRYRVTIEETENEEVSEIRITINEDE